MTDPIQLAIPRMAQWVARLSARDIPPSVRHCATRCVIDTVGVAIAGAGTPVARLAREAVQALAGSPAVSGPLGASLRLAPQQAAFVNGVAAHALDFDDNCYAGFVHGSAVIVPAAFAMAQSVDKTGAELLTALIAGAECEYAVGKASRNVLYEEGWWTTGILGPIGASAAASHLLGLDAVATANAIGLAVAGAGGMKSCFGTDGKALMAGRASESGVMCALLAARGARGPDDAFENQNGFAALINGGVFDSTVFDTLGAEWSLLDPGIDIKRVPVCLSSHAAVDLAMQLVREYAVTHEDIDSIVCDVPPIVRKNLAYDIPNTIQEAQFSMSFAIATSLREGDLGLEHLNSEWICNDALRSLMARIHMRTGPIWDDSQQRATAPEGASVTLRLRDGREYRAYRASAIGTASHPLSDDQLDGKFLSCANQVLDKGATRILLDNLRKMDSDLPARTLL